MKKLFMSLVNNCKSIIAKFKSKAHSEKNIIAVDNDSRIKDTIHLIEQLKKLDPNFGPELKRSSKMLNEALVILETNDGKDKAEMFERFYKNYLVPQSNEKQNDEVLNNRYLDILLKTTVSQLPN